MPRLIKPKPPKLLLPPPKDNTAQIDTLIQQFMTPEGLDYMDRIACERSLHSFLVDAWPSMFPAEFQDNWHLHAIAEHLEAVSKGQIRKLLINIQPRSSKPLDSRTRVLVKGRGHIHLGDVAIGDEILTHGGRFRRVTAVHEQGLLPVLKLVSKDGHSIVGASDHPFFTEQGLSNLGDLHLDQNVVRLANGLWSLSGVKSVEPAGHAECCCLTVEEDESFVANGFAVHNTALVSLAWPAWTWAQESNRDTPLIGPGVRFLAVTYAQNKSDEDSLRARRLLTSPWYKKHWGDRFDFMPDLNRTEHYANSKGGERISASFTGSVMGRGGDIKIIDDPHKMNEVESDNVREQVIRDFDEGIQNRSTDPRIAADVVIMQRSHAGDLSGHLMEKDGWTYLVIPTEYESDRHCQVFVDGNLFWEDPRHEEGELMWPDRFGPDELESFKELPYVWAGQYQQRPTPRGGGIIQADWWQNWPPEGWKEKQGKEFPAMDFVVASLDTAYTEKRSNDFSALTVWGIFRDTGTTETIAVPNWKGGIIEHIPILSEDERSKIMLMYGWQRRLTLHGTIEPDDLRICWEDCVVCKKHTNEWHDEDCPAYTEQRKPYWGLVEWTAHLCKKYRVNKLLIEDSAAGKPVQQELARLHRNSAWSVELVTVRGDKVARAHAISPLFSTGRIWAPLDMDWARLVQDQLMSLGKTRFDDLADCSVQALRYLRDHGMAVMAREEDATNESYWRRSSKTQPLYDV